MYRGDDILKIFDSELNPIGTATREEVHTKGILHQVAHVWMLQKTKDDLFIFFQKRSMSRDLFPGKYDLIQTTHFDPEESYEDGIIHSMAYYSGYHPKKEDIIHLGSCRQHIDEGDYHDNALVQVFAIRISKALFIMPDTEDIIKTRYEDFCRFVHGDLEKITIYTLDDSPLCETSRDQWWIRGEEFTEIVEPYIEYNN
jgi:isopentenyldiphosphate isomerase